MYFLAPLLSAPLLFAYAINRCSHDVTQFKSHTYFCRQMSRDMTKLTKWLCAQRRLRSARASADQCLCCPHEESLGPSLPIERTATTLIRLGGCPGWSESSLGAHHFAGFVMSHNYSCRQMLSTCAVNFSVILAYNCKWQFPIELSPFECTFSMCFSFKLHYFASDRSGASNAQPGCQQMIGNFTLWLGFRQYLTEIVLFLL